MRLAVFASGTGSNLLAIHDAIIEGSLVGELVLVVVDNLEAPVIEKAKARGLHTFVVNPKQFDNKTEYEKTILNELIRLEVEFIALAGYMRLLTEVILDPYKGKVVNIHPSLLPKYKGKDAVGQALAAKETNFGVTIHYVDEGMDTGSIVAQRSFEDNSDDRTQIEARIHKIEHELYATTLREIWEGLK